jgi:hypothetical protein
LIHTLKRRSDPLAIQLSKLWRFAVDFDVGVVVGEDLVVRTGPDGFDEAVRQPHVRPMDFTCRPMKGFVYVAPAGHQLSLRLEVMDTTGTGLCLKSTAELRVSEQASTNTKAYFQIFARSREVTMVEKD